MGRWISRARRSFDAPRRSAFEALQLHFQWFQSFDGTRENPTCPRQMGVEKRTTNIQVQLTCAIEVSIHIDRSATSPSIAPGPAEANHWERTRRHSPHGSAPPQGFDCQHKRKLKSPEERSEPRSAQIVLKMVFRSDFLPVWFWSSFVRRGGEQERRLGDGNGKTAGRTW